MTSFPHLAHYCNLTCMHTDEHAHKHIHHMCSQIQVLWFAARMFFAVSGSVCGRDIHKQQFPWWNCRRFFTFISILVSLGTNQQHGTMTLRCVHRPDITVCVAEGTGFIMSLPLLPFLSRSATDMLRSVYRNKFWIGLGDIFGHTRCRGWDKMPVPHNHFTSLATTLCCVENHLEWNKNLCTKSIQ